MSLAQDPSQQTPKKTLHRSDALFETGDFMSSPQETPESRGSAESRDEYGFCDTPEQWNGNNNMPLTPLTSPMPDHKDMSDPYLDLPKSPCPSLRKSKSDCHLTPPRNDPAFQADNPDVFQAENPDVFQADSPDVFQADSPDVFQADSPDVFQADSPDVFQADSPDVKIESNIQGHYLKEVRATPSTIPYHAREGSHFDFNNPGNSTPSRAPRRLQLKKEVTQKSNEDDVQPPGPEKSLDQHTPTDYTGCCDSPPPTPPDDSGPASAKIERSTSSAINHTVESETSSSNINIEQTQKVSSIKHTERLPSGGENIIQKSKVKERSSVHTSVRSKSFAKILPFNIQERLKEEATKCVACTKGKEKRRCKKQAKGSAEKTNHHLGMLSDVDVSVEFQDAIQIIKDVILSALCTWHKKVATRELDDCQAHLTDSSCSKDSSQPQNAAARRATFASWIKALTSKEPDAVKIAANKSTFVKTLSTSESNNPTVTSQVQTEATATSTTFRGPDYVHESVTTNRTTSEFYQQNFQPYRPNKGKYQAKWTVRQQLHDCLIRPLTPRELESGFIYVYWFPGNFGHLKIGKANDIEERLKQWSAQCKHGALEHRPSHEKFEVPNVYRVEALVHAELADYRVTEKDCPCSKTHREWFKIDEPHARRVVDRWTEWAREKRYALMPDGADKTPEEEEWRLWRLRDEGPGIVRELSKPLARTSVENPSLSAIKNHLRKSSRKNKGSYGDRFGVGGWEGSNGAAFDDLRV